MAYFAIDDNSGAKVSIKNWLLTRHTRGNPICIVNNCNAVLSIVAEHNPDRDTHFRHPANTNCPSVLANAIPYRQLQNIPIDQTQIQNIKILFLENLHRIFIKCQELIPNLSFSEFFDIVRYANHLNIWGYTAIDIEYIPYILCTCKNYFIQRNPYRTFSFHFIFGDVERVNELWINTNNNANVIYRVNRNTQDVEIINLEFNLETYNIGSNLPLYYVNLITNLIN